MKTTETYFENLHTPFGTVMYGRNFSSNKYRYGFNGKEKDDDVNVEGGSYDYVERFYDDRLARFLTIDPSAKRFPDLSTYQFASNRPIDGVDLDGLEYIRADKLVFQGLSADDFFDNSYKRTSYKGETYIYVGTHFYASDPNRLTGASNPNLKGAGARLTEWIYTDIAPVISKQDFVDWSAAKDCYGNTQLQLAKQKLESTPYWTDGVQNYKEGKTGLPVNQTSKLTAVDIINRSLENKQAIVVGIDATPGESDNPNTDATTDHFIVIVGRGEEKGKKYFLFYENATSSADRGTSKENKIFINDDGTLGNGKSINLGKFKVTQVRPSKAIKSTKAESTKKGATQ